MQVHSKQFQWIKTTCGKNVEFDIEDYEVLRQQPIFFDAQREIVMALWFSKEGKRTVAPVAKLLLGCEGKTIIHYKDGNGLNLKRDNIIHVNRNVSGQKMKKQAFRKGETPTSNYKGVSFNKFANKWAASIKIDYKKKHIGYFVEEKNAAIAYNDEAVKHWGLENARLNYIKGHPIYGKESPNILKQA